MRPDQCGTGRPQHELHPGDRAAIAEFVAFLTAPPEGRAHYVEIDRIRHGFQRRAITAGPPYHAEDLVHVVDGPHRGRWGQVVRLHDFRHNHKVGADNSHLCTWLVMVVLLTSRGRENVAYPPGPVPFEPHEIAPLFDNPAGECTGEWVRSGRVVSRKHWPHTRDGLGA